MLLGAGGSFGVIVQASGIGDYFVSLLQNWNISLLALGFVLCLLLRTAIGSSSVAMVTTTSIVAPLCGAMGESTVIVGLIVCAAGLAFATPTDAAFWIIQSLDDLSIKDTFRTYSFGTAIACAVLVILTLLLNICRGFLPGLNF